MTRFLKRTLFCLVPATVAALVLGLRPAAAQLVLQTVGLSCSDGTALNPAVSTTELIALSGAVSAINFFPAGDPALACSLSQDPPGSGNPHYDYAVGGGRVPVSDGSSCLANFSIDAHVPATQNAVLDAASGHVNYTIPATPACASSGQLRVAITCLDVGSQFALMRGTVEMATGFFSNPPPRPVFITARDQDMPATAPFDAITSPSDVFLSSQIVSALRLRLRLISPSSSRGLPQCPQTGE